jgi:peptidoglycan/LPS O-acetylase OafA/YrhL
MDIRTPRIHGLDTLRALAVTLVVLHHYTLFVSRADTFGWVGEMGWAGVDLFFALSGYLIGNQIFAALRSPGGLALPRFYARRLLRTLPNFYAVLALYLWWPAWRGSPPLLPLWKYLSFTQNILLEPGTAFSHAWSLCIEEQFYLALPACAVLCAALGRRGVAARWAWPLFAAAFAGGIAVRAHIWLDAPHGVGRLHFYYQHVYYATLCRADELLAGVALAYARHHSPAAWRRLLVGGTALLGAGVAAGALAFVLFLRDHYGDAVTVFGYPLLALSCALLIGAALAPGSPLHGARVPGAGALARWSYGIYLTHKSVCIMVAARLAGSGYGAGHPLTIACALGASLAAGWLLYRVVETPFMRLRERFVPGNGRAVRMPVERPAAAITTAP